MTPSDLCKQHGTTLAELARVSEQSQQTLINWFNNPKKRRLFELVLIGATHQTAQ